MRRMKIRFGKDESGAAMVEFAVVAGLIFIPLVFGILEFGRVIWTKNMVTAAAREGVRNLRHAARLAVRQPLGRAGGGVDKLRGRLQVEHQQIETLRFFVLGVNRRR